MRVLVSVIPVFKEDGIYLDIFYGTSHDQVGPLQEGAQLQAILEPPEVEAPKGGVRPSLRRAAKRSENKLAAEIGGKRQPNSGATPGAKGDVRKRGELRMECKTTTTKGYRVTRAELDKIRAEAGRNEVPGLVIQFIHPGTHREEDRWVLIPHEHWHEAYVHRRSGGKK